MSPAASPPCYSDSFKSLTFDKITAKMYFVYFSGPCMLPCYIWQIFHVYRPPVTEQPGKNRNLFLPHDCWLAHYWIKNKNSIIMMWILFSRYWTLFKCSIFTRLRRFNPSSTPPHGYHGTERWNCGIILWIIGVNHYFSLAFIMVTLLPTTILPNPVTQWLETTTSRVSSTVLHCYSCDAQLSDHFCWVW